MPIDIGKVRPGAKRLTEIALSEMRKKVANIQSGKVIRRKYAPSTERKRRKYGLRTTTVNLTGSTPYSRKSWRLWSSWAVVKNSDKSVSIVWTRPEAEIIYGYHVRRYGEFIKNA